MGQDGNRRAAKHSLKGIQRHRGLALKARTWKYPGDRSTLSILEFLRRPLHGFPGSPGCGLLLPLQVATVGAFLWHGPAFSAPGLQHSPVEARMGSFLASPLIHGRLTLAFSLPCPHFPVPSRGARTRSCAFRGGRLALVLVSAYNPTV